MGLLYSVKYMKYVVALIILKPGVGSLFGFACKINACKTAKI